MNQEEPNAIRSERLSLTSGSSLKVEMASGGGFVAVIRPKQQAEK